MSFHFRRLDTIYRARKAGRVTQEKTTPVESESFWKRAPKKKGSFYYFYKSLQVVLTFWIVTILAIITQPWLDYWVKSAFKPPQPSEILGQNNMLNNISATPLPSEVPAAERVGKFYLKNSAIEISAPIVEGISEEDLKKGIGHHPESPWPDEKGNVVIAGHNFDLDAENPYGKVFFELRKVNLGDQVTIEYQGKIYTYEVFNKTTVSPDDDSYFGPVDNWQITFYTCDPPYTDWKRIVYQARLMKVE